MRHNMQLGMGYYSPYIMMITMAIILVIAFLALRHKTPPNRYIIKLLDILKEKYAEGIISYDGYIKRKNIITEYEYLNPYSLLLLERYARCEIESYELFAVKKLVENDTIDILIRENLAKGVLSYDDYEKSKGQ